MATLAIKWLKRGLSTLFFIILVYLLAALIGSIFPANQSWQEPDDGIELFIETNGLHTGIIMPLRTDAHDWTELIRPEHMAEPSKYGSHILVGWGHEGVYRNAEVWSDLRLSDAASAVVGSDNVLLHVYHLNYPQAYPHYRRGFKVTEEQYLKIAKAIEAQFMLNGAGQPEPSKGYGPDDLFYRASGHYNAFNSCNSWTSNILKQAGVRTASWTPFSGGVMRWIPKNTDVD